MPKLCIVPTPIGNLEDITLRAIRMFKECDLIFAEDTRVTKKLLNNLTVLVSDAGTPGISDPGFLLARECVNAGIDLECLPGPTAFVPALVASGFPCDKFVFEGFLPHKKGRQTRLIKLSEEDRTVILYESPHRLVKCLGQLEEFFGPDRKVCVVREISKMFEEYKRGTTVEVKQYYEKNPPKGEIVIIVEGKQD